jgi:hypothetical protein
MNIAARPEIAIVIFDSTAPLGRRLLAPTRAPSGSGRTKCAAAPSFGSTVLGRPATGCTSPAGIRSTAPVSTPAARPHPKPETRTVRYGLPGGAHGTCTRRNGRLLGRFLARRHWRARSVWHAERDHTRYPLWVQLGARPGAPTSTAKPTRCRYRSSSRRYSTRASYIRVTLSRGSEPATGVAGSAGRQLEQHPEAADVGRHLG